MQEGSPTTTCVHPVLTASYVEPAALPCESHSLQNPLIDLNTTFSQTKALFWLDLDSLGFRLSALRNGDCDHAIFGCS
jgi:hypothetical protein